MIHKFLLISQAMKHLKILNMWQNFTDIYTFLCMWVKGFSREFIFLILSAFKVVKYMDPAENRLKK